MNTYAGKIPPWLALIFSMLFAFEMFNPSNLNILETSLTHHASLPTIHAITLR